MKKFTVARSAIAASIVSSKAPMMTDTDNSPLYEDTTGIQHDNKGSTVSGSSRSNPIPAVARRGGVLFENNSQYKLQRVNYAIAKKGILKVASLEDSLRSTLSLSDATNTRRSSLSLESLTSSLKNLFAGANQSPREGASLPIGMGLAGHGHECIPPQITFHSLDDSMDSTTREKVPQQQSLQSTKAVQFSDIDMRVYPVAPDDNPAVSKGPAIALSGWQYKTVSSITLDDYESTRGNHRRRTMEDLKLDTMERRRRLMEHGASQMEIAAFMRRTQKAKKMRLETLEATKIYGKHYEMRQELREEQLTRVRNFLSRALLGVRRTESQEQSALWDHAQQH
jgi:hypothetical protein